MSDRDLEKDVISFVENEVSPPRPKQITLDTEFDRDLRMIWEDVDTLLYKFFNEFNIDYSTFELTRYFPAPRYFIFNFRKSIKPKPLTIRMLVDAAARGAWSEKPITL